jgi:hypothetical protein
MNLRVPVVLLVVSVALLGSLVLGTVDTAAWTSGSTAVVRLDPGAGGSVCATGGGEAQRGVDMVLAAPPTVGPDVSEDAPTGRGALVLAEQDIERIAVGPFPPGAVESLRVELGADGWSWTGWADHPLFAWREWRSPGGPGEPRARTVSRCISADRPEWLVVGLRTDGGNEALLDIVNPYAVDATFAVTFRTESETVAPIALRNVSVPAATRVSVRVNDHVPEEPDLAAVVTVGAGRLGVEGRQRATAGVGGIEGMTTVAALTSPSDVWTFPWVLTGPEVEGAVWILNPEARPVVVEALVHTPQGVSEPEFVASLELAAGELLRLDTADLAPSGGRVFGLTLRSTAGVHVAAGARFLSDDPERTGLVHLLPSAAPDRMWLDAGMYTPERETVLHVVNLADDAADLSVLLTFTASDAPTDDGAPADGGSGVRTLAPGTLAPGASARIALPLDGRGVWSAVVTGGDGLVVSRTSTGSSRLEPVAIDALPSSAWRAPSIAVPARPFEGWAARLGTSEDHRRALRPDGVSGR